MTGGFTLATRSANLAGCMLVDSAACTVVGRLIGTYQPGPAKSTATPRIAVDAKRMSRCGGMFLYLRLLVSAMAGSPFPKTEHRVRGHIGKWCLGIKETCHKY